MRAFRGVRAPRWVPPVGVAREVQTPAASPIGRFLGINVPTNAPPRTAVFDLDAGSATITLPDAAKRFMSLIVIDEDHYVSGVYYGERNRPLRRKDTGPATSSRRSLSRHAQHRSEVEAAPHRHRSQRQCWPVSGRCQKVAQLRLR